MDYPSYYEYVSSEHREAADRYAFMLQQIGFNPFEELLKCCESLIASYVSTYFFPHYEVGDIEQEARLILIESLKNYQAHGKISFMQYFHMCLQNRLSNMVRSLQTLKRRPDRHNYSLEHLSEVSGVPADNLFAGRMHQPETLYCVRESYTHYCSRLSQLEEQVFQLFIAGVPYKDICRRLNIPFHAMKRALYRCSSKLRKTIHKTQANV